MADRSSVVLEERPTQPYSLALVRREKWPARELDGVHTLFEFSRRTRQPLRVIVPDLLEQLGECRTQVVEMLEDAQRP